MRAIAREHLASQVNAREVKEVTHECPQVRVCHVYMGDMEKQNSNNH
jgi:hypothetical protein